jgi:DNA-binding beta-propeller fold protein YncE
MRQKLIALIGTLILTVQMGPGVRINASSLPSAGAALKPNCASPTALVATQDGKWLFVACATDDRVAVLDVGANRITRSIRVPSSPLGMTLSKDGARLYVTCGAAVSTVCVVDVAQGQILERIPAGHTAMAPVLSPNEQTLYVCNRFDNDVSFIGLRPSRELRRIKVPREPVAADLTPDGRYLLVANHLHAGRAN